MKEVIGKTRKYSSRMHTARSLTGRGCCPDGGVELSGGGAVQGCGTEWCCLGVPSKWLPSGGVVVYWWMGGVQGEKWCPRGRGGVGRCPGVLGFIHNRK